MTFEKDTTGTVCLCSMKSGAWAGGLNHLKVSSLTRLGTDIDQDLRWRIGWDICSRPSRGYWASPQHGSWVLRAGVPREQCRSTCHFNDRSEKSLGTISTIVLGEAITKICPGSRARDMEPTTQQEGCQGDMVRRCGVEGIVGTIFGKYNLPPGLGRQTQDGGSCHCFSQTAASQITTGVANINGGQTGLSCLFDFTKGLGLTRQNDDTENLIL